MTDDLHSLQHTLWAPTRAGDVESCVFCVLNLWEKTRLPTSVVTSMEDDS